MSAKSKFVSKSDELIWTGNEMFTGTKTFAMYWNAMVTQLMKSGCYGAFEKVRPEPIAGFGAAALHREKMLSAWEIIDEKARGSVCETMPPGTPAGLFVHQWMEDERALILAAPADEPHPPISALRMRDALKERFNPLNTLTTETREKEWKSLTPEHKMPMSDYVDDFLFHTALYENALEVPLTEEAKKRRLLQSLSGRDEALLVQLAMNLQLDITASFGDIVTKLRLFDLTQFGQERILGKKSKNVNEVTCTFCKMIGHDEKFCRRKRRSLQKAGKSVSAVSAGKSGGNIEFRKCSECDRMHAGVCWKTNPDLAPRNWSGKNTDQKEKNPVAKATTQQGKKVGWSTKQAFGKPLKNPRAAAAIKADDDGGGSDASVSMLIIGLVDGAFDDLVAIDTGAQEDLVILTNGEAVKSMTPRSKTMGTADKKGKLRVSHEGESGEWKNIYISPDIQFSVCSGGRLRAYGYLLLDNCPPAIVDRNLKCVLVGTHVRSVPTFSVSELFLLPRLPAISLRRPALVGGSAESVS